MSAELSPRAIERLLEIGAPLRERPELGAVDLDRYELGKELGRGGMGVVYAAFDKELERKVALKLLPQAAGVSEGVRARFVREAKAAARLVHPHIASVYDATPEAIAMQLVDGVTLADYESSDPRELAALLRDAALAIHFAHGEGVVHRDLKPANLMVEERDRAHVFVMDFGLAKERAVDSSISISGSIVGTPAYMSPEQAAGKQSDVGPLSDVYGLGATLYACLCGSAPFEGEDFYRLLRDVVEREPAPLRTRVPRIDRDLETIVAKCMAKDPTRRYASALALASDLDRWLRGEAVAARPPSIAYRLRRFASRRQGAIATGGVAAALALLVAAPFLLQARAKRDTAERVFELSQRVTDALDDAATARESGLGHEGRAFAILQEAIADCRSFLAQTDSAHGWFFLGRTLREQMRYEEALDAFDRAAERSPDLEGLARYRGLTLAALYRNAAPVLGEAPPPELEEYRTRGVSDLERCLERAGSAITPELILVEAHLAWLLGDLEGAVAKHKAVLEMNPLHQESHLSLTRLFVLLGRDDLAGHHSVVATDLMRGNRPAYIAQGSGLSGDALEPERELLAIEGMRELLIDFNLLLRTEPGNAHTSGFRGQVQLRSALRTQASDAQQAKALFDLAIREYDAALTLREGYAPALINRGVARVQLARLLSASDPLRAAQMLRAANQDFGRALAADDTLAVAWYDRALLAQFRANQAFLGRDAVGASEARARARSDARRALAAASADHPGLARFEALARELE